MDRSLYSDLYKDVYGFRPRGEAMARVRRMTDAEFEAEWAYLQRELSHEMAIEQAGELRQSRGLLQRLRGLRQQHGIDAAAALRWDFDASDAPLEDPDYYAYLHGLPYHGPLQELIVHGAAAARRPA